tara:strand:+ start:105 stop:524 length:420 start_codon:yes stop_codon:yes gene_type:complete
MKKIRITEAEIKRLVKKVITESYGATSVGGFGFGDTDTSDVGLGYGFDEPIISQYSGGGSEMDLDEQDEVAPEVDDENTEDEGEEDTSKVQSGSSKYSEADVQAVKLVIQGKKKTNELTVNQRKLYSSLSGIIKGASKI